MAHPMMHGPPERRVGQRVRPMVDDVLRYKRLDGVQEALTTVAAAMYPSGNQTAVLTRQLDRLTVPALVVWGEQDRVLPPPTPRPWPATPGSSG